MRSRVGGPKDGQIAHVTAGQWARGNHCVVSGKFFFDSIADNGPTQWAETLGTGLGPTSDWFIVPGWDRVETGHPAELAQKSGQTQKAPLNKDRLHRSCQRRQREMGLDPGAPSSSLYPKSSLAKLLTTRAAHCVCGTVWFCVAGPRSHSSQGEARTEPIAAPSTSVILISSSLPQRPGEVGLLDI